MYWFREEINWHAHFWFDKRLITSGLWAKLPKASKSVYPVIGCFRNAQGLSYPSERTIAILCGRSEKTVRAGIRGLEGLYNLKIFGYLTPRGRRSRKFYLAAPPKRPGRAFPFYRCLLEKGLWQDLTPTAQALYPVLRCFGFFDADLYRAFVDPEFQDAALDTVLASRDFDFCEADPMELVRHAGISKPSLLPALQSLKKNRLVKALDPDPRGRGSLWQVYFKTTAWYPREYLNEKVRKRYGPRGPDPEGDA